MGLACVEEDFGCAYPKRWGELSLVGGMVERSGDPKRGFVRFGDACGFAMNVSGIAVWFLGDCLVCPPVCWYLVGVRSCEGEEVIHDEREGESKGGLRSESELRRFFLTRTVGFVGVTSPIVLRTAKDRCELPGRELYPSFGV